MLPVNDYTNPARRIADSMRSGTAKRIARLRGSDAHSKGPPGELKNAFFGNESTGNRVCEVRPCLL